MPIQLQQCALHLEEQRYLKHGTSVTIEEQKDIESRVHGD